MPLPFQYYADEIPVQSRSDMILTDRCLRTPSVKYSYKQVTYKLKAPLFGQKMLILQSKNIKHIRNVKDA